MTNEEIKDELYRMLSDVVNGGYPIRNNTQKGRYREAVKEAIKALEQEPCEDEYIKVPKKALKYRTAGMVAYNAEWLKNHFDIERTVICGEEPCGDCISRQAVLDALDNIKYSNEFCEEHHIDWSINLGMAHIVVNKLKPVTLQQRTGHWIIMDDCEHFIAKCSECGRIEDSRMINKYPYCHCGAKMQEVEE